MPITDKHAAGARVVFLGDSIVQYNNFASALELSSHSRGEISWARVLDSRFSFPVYHDPSDLRMGRLNDGANQGIAADHTENVIARLGDVFSQDPDVVILAVGTNDINSKDSAEVVIGNLRVIVDNLRAEGIDVILGTIRVREQGLILGWPAGDARWGVLDTVNQWIASFAAQTDGVVLWDPNTALRAPGEVGARGGTTLDGVHLNTLGAFASAKTLVEALSEAIEPGSWFDTDAAADTLLLNPLLLGTSGTKGAGVEGVVPTNWNLSRAQPGGSSVATGESIADGVDDKQFRIAFSSSGSAANETFLLQQQSFRVPVSASAGQWVQLAFKVDVGVWGGWAGISLYLQDSVSGEFSRGLRTASNWTFVSEAFGGWIWSEPLKLSANAASARAYLAIDVKNAAGTGILTVDDVIFRTVGAPDAHVITVDPLAKTFVGTAADDVFTVTNLRDLVVEVAGGGRDTINTSVDYTLPAEVEVLNLTGAAQSGTGNALANLVNGNGLANRIDGAAGNDTLYGNAGSDTLLGGAGDDLLYGGADADELQGGDGNDTLDGGSGGDIMAGGAGNDTYLFDNTADMALETAADGSDTGGIDGINTVVSTVLAAFIENGRALGTVGVAITGNSLNNLLRGNSAANILEGLNGNDTLNGDGGMDTLFGGAGNDALNGGAGADLMSGGSGDDVYYVDDIGDVVSEQGALPGLDSGGTDTIWSTVSYVLPAFVEHLTLAGTSGLAGTGNGLSNRITGTGGSDTLAGGDGNDTLLGMAGDDVIIGGEGADTLTGGAGADQFVFTALSGRPDTITDFAAGSDRLVVDFGFTAAGQPAWPTTLVIDSVLGQGVAGFVYTSALRTLSWDADGSGGLTPIEIVTFSAGVALTTQDILLI